MRKKRGKAEQYEAEMEQLEPIDSNSLTKDGRRRWHRLTKEAQALTMQAMAPLVIQGRKQAEIAQILGISPQIVQRLTQADGFAAILDEYRREMLRRVREKLWSATDIAVDTLLELAQSARSEHVRFEAANAILVQSKLAEMPVEESGEEAQLKLLEELRKKVTERAQPVIRIEKGVVMLDSLRPGETKPGQIIDLTPGAFVPPEGAGASSPGESGPGVLLAPGVRPELEAGEASSQGEAPDLQGVPDGGSVQAVDEACGHG